MSNNSSISFSVEDRVAVFFSGKDHVVRIPALVYLKDKKVLLAFAEKRKNTNDVSTEKLIMKTGEVNGDKNKNRKMQWSDLRELAEATLTDHRPMNPCPVYDQTNKKLFLFFNCIYVGATEWWQIDHYHNMTRLCYITSTDAGLTWSPVTDLTENLPQIRNWATFSVGPGHGLQSQNRLIVPAYAYTLCYKYDGKGPKTEPHALSLYSDDNGVTWQFGKMLEETSLECEMAEFYDEAGNLKIYCNARSKKKHRVEAVSDDGNSFTGKTSTLVETGGGCQGSVVSFPDLGTKDNNQNKWLLHIHPHDKSDRKDLGVSVNKTPSDLKKWSKPWIINDGPSGYSDVAHTEADYFVCLFECGVKAYTEKIDSVFFSYDGNDKATSAKTGCVCL